jgi:hypothetical protein
MATVERVSSIPELSIVTLRRSLHPRECAGRELPEGTRGVVVHVYPEGAAYEVEFANPFPCVVTTRSDDIRQV